MAKKPLPTQDLAEELEKQISDPNIDPTVSVYKGASRIGTDIDEQDNGDTKKLSMVQEAGLTPKERQMLKLMLRGITGVTIARLLDVSIKYVYDTKANIKKKLSAAGEHIDQGYLVGYTVSVFEEVEEKAWEMFYRASEDKGMKDKAKALDLVMKAREKQTKLMMDVGLIKKADNTVTHEVTMSPFLEKWDSGGKQAIVKAMVESTLDKLADPIAPDSEYTGVNTTEEESDEPEEDEETLGK